MFFCKHLGNSIPGNSKTPCQCTAQKLQDLVIKSLGGIADKSLLNVSSFVFFGQKNSLSYGHQNIVEFSLRLSPKIIHESEGVFRRVAFMTNFSNIVITI